MKKEAPKQQIAFFLDATKPPEEEFLLALLAQIHTYEETAKDVGGKLKIRVVCLGEYSLEYREHFLGYYVSIFPASPEELPYLALEKVKEFFALREQDHANRIPIAVLTVDLSKSDPKRIEEILEQEGPAGWIELFLPSDPSMDAFYSRLEVKVLPGEAPIKEAFGSMEEPMFDGNPAEPMMLVAAFCDLSADQALSVAIWDKAKRFPEELFAALGPSRRVEVAIYCSQTTKPPLPLTPFEAWKERPFDLTMPTGQECAPKQAFRDMLLDLSQHRNALRDEGIDVLPPDVLIFSSGAFLSDLTKTDREAFFPSGILRHYGSRTIYDFRFDAPIAFRLHLEKVRHIHHLFPLGVLGRLKPFGLFDGGLDSWDI